MFFALVYDGQLTYCRSKPRHLSSMTPIIDIQLTPPADGKCYRYCVRPNSGRIEPGKDVEVQSMEFPQYALPRGVPA